MDMNFQFPVVTIVRVNNILWLVRESIPKFLTFIYVLQLRFERIEQTIIVSMSRGASPEDIAITVALYSASSRRRLIASNYLVSHMNRLLLRYHDRNQ